MVSAACFCYIIYFGSLLLWARKEKQQIIEQNKELKAQIDIFKSNIDIYKQKIIELKENSIKKDFKAL